jgi:cation transport regulator ChaB
MPYSSTKDLPKQAQALPEGAKKIFVAAFNNAVKDNDEQTAFQIAWAAVKRKYKQADGKWVLKSGDEMTVITDIAMHETMFLDAAGSTGLVITPEGYLKAAPRIARTGIQLYSGDELGWENKPVVRVYRPETEVFSLDALKGLSNRPVTINHPDQMVDSKNWKQHAVGHLGSDHRDSLKGATAWQP